MWTKESQSSDFQSQVAGCMPWSDAAQLFY